jgi:hypothetical protein
LKQHNFWISVKKIFANLHSLKQNKHFHFLICDIRGFIHFILVCVLPFLKQRSKSFYPIAHRRDLLPLGLVGDAEGFSLDRFLGTLSCCDLSGKRSVQFLALKKQEF